MRQLETCRTIIKSFFSVKGIIIAKTYFNTTPDKVIIQIYYYKTRKSGFIKINSLLSALNSLLQCRVLIRLVRLNHLSLDSNLLAQTIASNTSKYNFNRIIKIIRSKLPLLTYQGRGLTGIKVKLSGRLTTQRSIPRQTVQASRIGNKQFNSLTDYGQFTSKNKLGAFTVKVWLNIITHNTSM